MNKRAVIAFLLSLLVIVSYNQYMAKNYAPAQPPSAQEAQPTTAPAQAQTPPLSPPSLVGQDIIVETDLMRVVFTQSGARVKSCQLKKYAAEKLSAEDADKTLAKLEQALVNAPQQQRENILQQKLRQQLLLKRLANEPATAELVSLEAQAQADFTPKLIFPDDKTTNVEINTGLYQAAPKELLLDKSNPAAKIQFSFTDAGGRKVIKTYGFSNDNYLIDCEIEFINWPAGTNKNLLIYSAPDVGMPQAQNARRVSSYQGPVSAFHNGQQNWTQKEKYDRSEQNTFVRREYKDKGRILWTALENKYFLAALIPTQSAQSILIEKNSLGAQKVALNIPWSGAGKYAFRLYLGPKQEKQLNQAGVSLEKTIDYGFFSPIARFIYQALVLFKGWTGNFGWAIILLSVLIKVIFYPLTHRSFEAMQKMQKQTKTLQPEMTALRAKHKDNPQKLNKEIMGLYRKHGVNPLASCQSGCLPLFLQMPVFFALYAVLYNSIELRGTPFIGWIQDLSAKDPYYILPVLMGISMFAQNKLMGMDTASGAQPDQAKMMTMFMPIFLTWIFASLPSGVVLYWLTFNVLTALQQVAIKKKAVIGG